MIIKNQEIYGIKTIQSLEHISIKQHYGDKYIYRYIRIASMCAILFCIRHTSHNILYDKYSSVCYPVLMNCFLEHLIVILLYLNI